MIKNAQCQRECILSASLCMTSLALPVCLLTPCLITLFIACGVESFIPYPAASKRLLLAAWFSKVHPAMKVIAAMGAITEKGEVAWVI